MRSWCTGTWGPGGREGGECQAGGQTIPLGEAWAEPNIFMNYIEPYMPVMFPYLGMSRIFSQHV